MNVVYEMHPDLRLTEVEGEGIVLHLGSRRYFSVSESGLLILSTLREAPCGVADLVERLMGEYDVSEPDAEESVREFLSLCCETRLISKRD